MTQIHLYINIFLLFSCRTSTRVLYLYYKTIAWVLENPGQQVIRSLDFNANKQYYLAFGGDDASIKFYDLRSPKSPLLTRSTDHSHWIWCLRLNQFHDQLYLSGGSDSRVILTSVSSISSESYGLSHASSSSPSSSPPSSSSYLESPLIDGVIQVYEDHEDSVYAVEWSESDPWTFASLSYDGRLVINTVPRSVKFKLLNLI